MLAFIPAWLREIFWAAVGISGYEDAPAAVKVIIACGIIYLWFYLKPKTDKWCRHRWGRGKVARIASISVLSLLTIAMLIPLSLQYGHKPTRLQLEVQDSYILNVGKDDWQLFLLVNVRNIGEVPAVPEKIRVRVMDGSTALGPFESLPVNGKGIGVHSDDSPGDKTFYIPGDDFLERRLVKSPVAPGQPINGWLTFNLFGTRDGKNMELFLDFDDSFGNADTVTLDMPRTIPPMPEAKMFRGVTYPFREKKSVPN